MSRFPACVVSTVLCLALAASTPAARAASVEADLRATFGHFVAAQNAHDVSAVGALLSDSPSFLWVTRGAAIWGREAALARFAENYKGTWRLAPDTTGFRVVFATRDAAQLHVPVVFTIGPPGGPATETTFLLHQTLVREGGAWKVASILPIAVPAPAAAPTPAPAR
jgi:hypothetical protein